MRREEALAGCHSLASAEELVMPEFDYADGKRLTIKVVLFLFKFLISSLNSVLDW